MNDTKFIPLTRNKIYASFTPNMSDYPSDDITIIANAIYEAREVHNLPDTYVDAALEALDRIRHLITSITRPEETTPECEKNLRKRTKTPTYDYAEGYRCGWIDAQIEFTSKLFEKTTENYQEINKTLDEIVNLIKEEKDDE